MNLYLHIEIYNREFQSKLLIAMESASKGMQVYVGRLKEYLLRDFFVPGIVHFKSITPSDRKLKELKFFKKNNFIITSLDEEVGLTEKNSKYIKARYSNKSLELTDRVFTWGKFDYDNLSTKFKKHKKKLVKSGNPRIDFWRKDFEFFFKKKKLRYKDYILFSLNYKHRSNKELKKYSDWLKEMGYMDRGYTINEVKKNNKYDTRISKKIFKLITTLSGQTNLTIIVRPHPIDELKNYKFLNKYKNIKIIKEGSISEWIYNAKIVVHSSCTGGLEASVRGRPTVSYLPFKNTSKHEFTNKYSKKTKNLNDCLNNIKKIISNNTKIKKSNLKDFNLRAYNFLSDKPAYKKIADEFLRLIKINKINKHNNNLFLKFRFTIRDIRSKILKLKYGNVKFSFFDRDETLKIFEILKQLNPKFNDLKINFIKKDIIQIKRAD
jgi:surface carbohydrate biosynthesis protein